MAKECNDCDELNLATLQNANADLKTQLDAANNQVKTLTDKAEESVKLMKEATDALNEYMAADKKLLLESITKRSEFTADDLKDKTVKELRTINFTIDKAKPPEGTVKSVRGADGTAPTRLNITADGKLNPGISLMGIPVRQADGSIKWEIKQ